MMHILCVFILKLYSTCFERIHRSSLGVTYCLYAAVCTYHANCDWLLDISSWNRIDYVGLRVIDRFYQLR